MPPTTHHYSPLLIVEHVFLPTNAGSNNKNVACQLFFVIGWGNWLDNGLQTPHRLDAAMMKHIISMSTLFQVSNKTRTSWAQWDLLNPFQFKRELCNWIFFPVASTSTVVVDFAASYQLDSSKVTSLSSHFSPHSSTLNFLLQPGTMMSEPSNCHCWLCRLVLLECGFQSNFPADGVGCPPA